MRRIPLETPLAAISGIGPRFAVRLKKLGLLTVRDLLWHFPARYEDLSQIVKISEAEAGMRIAISGVIHEVRLRRTARRNMAIVEALISDETGSIHALWFNQPYLANTLRAGRWGNFAGKVAVNDELYLQHPEFELISAPTAAYTQELRHTGKLVPIYSETKGLTSKGLRFLIQPLLGAVVNAPEWIPEGILKKENIPEVNKALRQIHLPETLDHALVAKRRFAFEELLLMQLLHLMERSQLAKERAHVIEQDIEYVKKILGTLPFELTFSQKRSLWEILQNLSRPQPMNRLLQGDVGSGKTVVAAIAAFLTARRGYQTAFMAPTEILARQHFATLGSMLATLPSNEIPAIGILTSSEAKIIYEGSLETKVKKSEFIKQIENGNIAIVLGTHALIEKTVGFKNLALVVIDEQHRFGVRQRQALIRNANDVNSHDYSDSHISHRVPHLLSMTATPIPRTLMLSIFGDLDISLIDELPVGRKPIVTKIVPPRERETAYEFIREEIKNGRQAFVICPRIESNANDANDMRMTRTEFDDSHHSHADSNFSHRFNEIKAVKEEYEKLSTKVFADLTVAMLHGKMKANEKSEIMNQFKEGKVHILVSTSVVEVGVDIPNASVMMIEGSDRFGLAQLYQFRGRVGRGEYQSHCLLMTDSSLKSTEERLKALLTAKNGMELAEYDLKMRGPGEFLGNRQTGIPDYAMHALQDPQLVTSSRSAAATLFAKNANLNPYPLLQAKLAAFQKTIHPE